jgi:hypothetical protein
MNSINKYEIVLSTVRGSGNGYISGGNRSIYINAYTAKDAVYQMKSTHGMGQFDTVIYVGPPINEEESKKETLPIGTSGGSE